MQKFFTLILQLFIMELNRWLKYVQLAFLHIIDNRDGTSIFVLYYDKFA